MQRILGIGVAIIISITILGVESLSAAQQADACARKGILVKNMTMLDLWYKRNGGDCKIWIHNHVLFIKPKGSVEIFSDMACSTLYCGPNPSYKTYKSIDENSDCKVRILPDCSLSDI